MSFIVKDFGPQSWAAFSCRVSLVSFNLKQFFIKKKKKVYLFIWLHQVLVAACRIFSCGMQALSCSMWNLVPRPGIKAQSPALSIQSLSHCKTREVLSSSFSIFITWHFWGWHASYLQNVLKFGFVLMFPHS